MHSCNNGCPAGGSGLTMLTTYYICIGIINTGKHQASIESHRVWEKFMGLSCTGPNSPYLKICERRARFSVLETKCNRQIRFASLFLFFFCTGAGPVSEDDWAKSPLNAGGGQSRRTHRTHRSTHSRTMASDSKRYSGRVQKV